MTKRPGRLKRILHVPPATLLRISAVLTILGLIFMMWSMLDPTPLPVMLAMSVGQAVGTLAFALFGVAILQDLLRLRRAARQAAFAHPPGTPAPAAAGGEPPGAPPS